MNTHIIAFTFLSALLLVFSCQTSKTPLEADSRPNAPRALTASEESIVQAGNIFGLNLLQEINRSEQDSNIFISPLSVSFALGMTMNGAAGETFQAMRNTLQFEGLSEEEINNTYLQLIELLTHLDDQVLFEIANSIWYKQGFAVQNLFIEKNKKYFNAETREIDFSTPAALEAINGWVSEKTHGKIDKILDFIPPDAIMYLINAIYFKATWLYEFDAELTRQETFFGPHGAALPCRMMHIEGDFEYYSDDQVQIIDLPYGSGLYSMTIFLPAAGNDLVNWLQELSGDQLDFYLNHLDSAAVALAMPKFKLEYSIKLNDALIALGMGPAFSGAADFSRINPNRELYISRVLHKTFVQVDEEGTEAAAVTAVELRETSIGGGPLPMRADRPFLFTIREKHSGSRIFWGIVVNPEWTE